MDVLKHRPLNKEYGNSVAIFSNPKKKKKKRDDLEIPKVKSWVSGV